MHSHKEPSNNAREGTVIPPDNAAPPKAEATPHEPPIIDASTIKDSPHTRRPAGGKPGAGGIAEELEKGGKWAKFVEEGHALKAGLAFAGTALVVTGVVLAVKHHNRKIAEQANAQAAI